MNTKRRFFGQPKKKETLARKRVERVRRLNHLRGRLSDSSVWWVKMGEAFGVTALFLTSFFLLYPFFGHEDRFNVFSAPVVPVLASATERFMPFSYGVRVWLLMFLVFFPCSFYFFVREISGRKLAGFLASLITCLPIGIFLPLRVSLGLLGQDGGHIASLTLIPLVCLLLLRFLRFGNFWTGIFSSLGMTFVALTSPIGLVVLSVFMGITAFSEMLLGRGRLKAIRFFFVLILTVGFSAFWYNPKFVILTLQSSRGQLLKKTLANLLPLSFFLLPLLGIFGFLLFENRPQLQPMFIALFLTIGFGLFSLGAGVAHPSPSRFLPAFGISLAFLAGILSVWIFDFLRFSPKVERFKTVSAFRRIIAYGLVGLFFVLTIVIIGFFGRNLWQLEKTQVLGLVAEQKVGIWEIKEKTTVLESVLGYTITGLTGLGVAILKAKLGM